MSMMNRSAMRMSYVSLLATATLFSTAAAARAADWPNFRGPNHNGISPETGLNLRFGPAGPRKVWTAPVGQGFSSISVAGGKAYTMGNDGRNDTVWCLNATNGQVVWRYTYPCDPGGGGYGGPRATPSVEGNRVYSQSNDGRVYCLDTANGKVIWLRNVAGEVRASQPQWGFAGSPLIEGNLVYVNIGRAGVGLDKATGRVVWTSGAGSSGYSTPVPFTQGGQKSIAMFVGEGVMGVHPTTGKQMWVHPWETSYEVNAADPIIIGDTCFISSGYNHGCALLSIGSGRPKVIWENRNMRNHFNASVIHNWGIFGNDDGTLRCLDSRTGAEKWSTRGMGKGGVILADGTLIALTERGELVTAEATPAKYTELGRAKLLNSRSNQCWSQPALANGLIYVKSYEGELVCVDVKK